MKKRKSFRIPTGYVMLLILVACFGLIVYNTPRVYVCMGPYSQCYHKLKYCEGMMACRGEKKKVNCREAVKMGLRECNYCYHRNRYDPDYYPLDPWEAHPWP